LGWTSYDDRIACQTYDVTTLLRPGKNRLEIWLGDGWYRSRLMSGLNPIPDTWGTRIGAFAELVARGKIILKSDASWRSGQTCGAHVRVEFSDVVGPDQAFDNRNCKARAWKPMLRSLPYSVSAMPVSL
jgi:Alpha-L-rhamnosidase N-terminal domain